MNIICNENNKDKKKKSVKWVLFCYIVGHYNWCIKFESNEKYHCIRKTILKMICQPSI